MRELTRFESVKYLMGSESRISRKRSGPNLADCLGLQFSPLSGWQSLPAVAKLPISLKSWGHRCNAKKNASRFKIIPSA